MSVRTTTTSTRRRGTAVRLARAVAPATLALTGAAALALATPLAASAHVSMTADTTAAGADAVLSLNVPHGCEGSPTTRIAIKIPAGVNAVTPTVNPGWTAVITKERLAHPLTEDDGDQLTTRVSSVVWTAKSPLSPDFRDVLALQVAIPEDAAGTQLAFPTVQTCVQGSTRWTQVPAPGQDHDELERPAPVIEVTAAVAESEHDHGTVATAPHVGEHTEVTASDDLQATAAMPSSDIGLGLAGLVLGALGLAAGTLALFRTRSLPATQD